MKSKIGLTGLATFATAAILATGSLPAAHQARIPAPHQHRPADIRNHRVDGTFESTNWSGYAVTGTNFTGVTGSWVIPASTCAAKSSAEYAAFWIGIDGWTSNSVEQTGTDSDCSNGKPSYYAWYEFYPNPSYYAGRLTNLSPGDVMTSSVTYNSSKNQFSATITDTTKNLSYTATFTPSRFGTPPARTSAEWIAEAPSGQVGRKIQVLPLADFNVINFGPDYTPYTQTATVGAGTPGSIGSFCPTLSSSGVGGCANLNISTMVSDTTSAPMATPSPVSQDGTSFSVAWNSVGP